MHRQRNGLILQQVKQGKEEMFRFLNKLTTPKEEREKVRTQKGYSKNKNKI